MKILNKWFSENSLCLRLKTWFSDIPFKWSQVYSVILIFIASLMIVGQFSTAVSFISLRADSRSIIVANDDDSAWAITTAMNTRLWNSNSFHPYGPLYYRLVHVLDHFTKNPFTDLTLSEGEQMERSHHFLLMLVSLVSVYLLGMLLVSILTEDWLWRLLGTYFLMSAFLYDPVWTYMILRPHPDLLLGFCVAVSMLFSYRALISGKDRDWIFLAIAWAVTANVKLVMLFFMPPLMVFFWPWNTQEFWRRFKLFAKYFFATYFLVGFPQSFSLSGNIGFLFSHTRNSSTVDWPFFQSWMNLFFTQLWRPVLVLLFLAIVVQLRTNWLARVKLNFLIKSFLLIGIPCAFLVSQKLTCAYDYYPIPFVAGVLVWVTVMLLGMFNTILQKSISKFFENIKNFRLLPLLVIIVGPWIIQPVSSEIDVQFHRQMTCNKEFHQVKDMVSQTVSHGGDVLIDPMTPYDFKFHDKEVRLFWEQHLENIIPGKTSLIVLRRGYYLRYLPFEESGINEAVNHVEDWVKVRDFYHLFFKKNLVQDPYGQTWKKIFDECDLEVWQLTGTLIGK